MTDRAGDDDPRSELVFREVAAISSVVTRALAAPASTLSGGSVAGSMDGTRGAVPTSEVQVTVEQLVSELKGQKTERGTLISLPGDILFDFDKSDIRADARPVLEKLALLIDKLPEAPVAIEGHTDSKGSDSYNQSLSERRALSVRDYLTGNFDLARRDMQTVGFGESRPVAPNSAPDGTDDPAGRQLNRRVEVIIAD